MKKQKKTRILIIFIAGIGDVILFIPVLNGLMKHYKDCEISVIVPPELVSCVKKIPCFTDVVISETSGENGLLKRLMQLAGLCIFVLKKNFDIVITPLAVNCATASLISRLSRAKTKIGYTGSNEGRTPFTESIKIMPFEHDMIQNLKVLERLHINPPDKKMAFYLSESDREDAAVFLKDNGISAKDTLVAFHPVTYDRKGYNRNWPADKYAGLGRRICREYGAKIIILGSAGERKAAEEIKAVIGERAIVQSGKTSIHAAAATLERCKLLVCNDSSIMHIGAAIGVPMVAIWGPTDPRRRGHSGRDQIVIRKELPCSPCRESLKNCETRECLTQIPVEEVFESCRGILSGKREKQIKRDADFSDARR